MSLFRHRWRTSKKTSTYSCFWKWRIGIVRRGDKTFDWSCSWNWTYARYRKKIIQLNLKTAYRKTNLYLSHFTHWNGIQEKSLSILFSIKLYELLIDKHCYVHGFDFWNYFLLVFLNFHRLVIELFFVEWKWIYEINIKKVNTLFGGAFHHVRKPENEEFVGTSGTRTLFTIESDTGKDICQHSFFEKEDEILLLPGREFEIISSAYMGNQLTMIQLKEVQPAFPNLPSLPSSNPPFSTSTVSIPSPTTVTAPSVQPKPIIKPVEVSYSFNQLTDNDIPRIIKEALEQQQCTILNLRSNKIRHRGAALLSEALKHNQVSWWISLRVETLWHLNSERKHFKRENYKKNEFQQ